MCAEVMCSSEDLHCTSCNRNDWHAHVTIKHFWTPISVKWSATFFAWYTCINMSFHLYLFHLIDWDKNYFVTLQNTWYQQIMDAIEIYNFNTMGSNITFHGVNIINQHKNMIILSVKELDKSLLNNWYSHDYHKLLQDALIHADGISVVDLWSLKYVWL